MKTHEYAIIYTAVRNLGHSEEDTNEIIERFKSQTVGDYIDLLQSVQEAVVKRMGEYGTSI